MHRINHIEKDRDEFLYLSHKISLIAIGNIPRIDFIKKFSEIFLEFSGCEEIEIWIKFNDTKECFESAVINSKSFDYKVITFRNNSTQDYTSEDKSVDILVWLCHKVFIGYFDLELPFFTRKGSLWTGDIKKTICSFHEAGVRMPAGALTLTTNHKSFALIPILLGKDRIGVLQLKSSKSNFFTQNEIKSYEDIAPVMGAAVINQFVRSALAERVKELTCLYGIAKIAEKTENTLDIIFNDIIQLLPPAWQYPEITCGKITFDNRSFSTYSSGKISDSLRADIVVVGRKRGFVEVLYLKEMPGFDEGPFLKEERNLINTIAENIALIIERKEAAEERVKLQIQLRHADRLATIGQLAAGVAHELNEPLGNILGLAQLACKSGKINQDIENDLKKIIRVSLDAREIIKQLMIFARQKKPEKTKINLNKIINEGLTFFESRCEKEGIKLIRELLKNLPEITADPSQIQQVLVNLITNSIQAMPSGGTLTIKTCLSDNYVSFVVEDSGIGMSEEEKKQMFVPFFTSKEVGEGTGIGLSVVHGVVISHHGRIKVESELGQGSRFEIQLPLNNDLEKNK